MRKKKIFFRISTEIEEKEKRSRAQAESSHSLSLSTFAARSLAFSVFSLSLRFFAGIFTKFVHSEDQSGRNLFVINKRNS